MIPTFDEQTSPLSDYEKETLLPLMIQGFKTKIGVKNCVTNPQICRALNDKGYKVTEPRVRKLVFHIRHNNLVPKLIASSKGYWIATSRDEVESWLESVNSRIGALMETKKYAEEMLMKWDRPASESQLIQTQLFDKYGS